MKMRGLEWVAVELNLSIPEIDVVAHLPEVWIVESLFGTGGHSERLVEFAWWKDSNGDLIPWTDWWGEPPSMNLAILRSIEHAKTTDVQVVNSFFIGVFNVTESNGEPSISVDSGNADPFSVLQYFKSRRHVEIGRILSCNESLPADWARCETTKLSGIVCRDYPGSYQKPPRRYRHPLTQQVKR